MEISWESRYDRPAVTGLSVGKRLGRFEIVSALGAGGMGEVYRAHDPQLSRDVAIKLLPREWSGDPVRQQRLEGEARIAASLNHPNVVAVYDFGVADGALFIVTELLQGDTLRQCMRERALAPQKAIDYAIGVASGLAAGHSRGTVHGDIKPENVFVTGDGVVKILDFGLARSVDSGLAENTNTTLTVEEAPSRPLAGTASYMSPEQARGLRTDHRSDIFSLGSLLYEMLMGVPPFRRDTVADTLSAILHEEPEGLTNAERVPPALARIVSHCLEKRPDDRFQHARDLMFDLQALSNSSSTTMAPSHQRAPASVGARWGLAIALATAAGVAGYLIGNRAIPPSPRTAAPAVHRLTELTGLEEFPAISPDGRSVAFTATVNGRRQIFVRLLTGGTPLALTKDPLDHQQPRWAPDGNSLFYFTSGPNDEQGAIWAIRALGGSPRRVMASASGADVSRTGRLTCFRLDGGSLQLVTAAPDGTDTRVVIPASSGHHRFPRWSPDERWIAFQRGDGVRDDVFVVPSTGGEVRRVTNDRAVLAGLTWLPSNDGIVYATSRGSTIPYLPPLRLWQTRLDGGEAHALTGGDSSYELPDLNPTGVASAARLRMRFDIWRIPFEGTAATNVRNAQPITNQTGQVLTPTVAPNGDDIAFLADHGGRANLWVLSTRTGEMRQVTFENDPAAAVGVPSWSPDGKWIAFVSSKGRTGFDFGVWLVRPDGGNLHNIARQGLGTAWSPDGQWLYYSDTSAGALKKIPASGGEAVVVRAEPTRNAIGLHQGTLYYMVERPLVDGRLDYEIHQATPEDGPSRVIGRIAASRVAPWQIVNPALSPDGQWLALPLTDGLTTNIWAMSTKTGEWRQITDFGDRAIFIARRVSWSPDGQSLLAAIGEGDADIVLFDGLF
jgi:Tol biopolymer transport system component